MTSTLKTCAPAIIILGDQKSTADINYIEVQDIEWRRGLQRGLACCGQGRVGPGSPSPLASRLAGLPVVSSNPPPPLMVFLQQQPSCSLMQTPGISRYKEGLYFQWMTGRKLGWNNSDAEDGLRAGYWIWSKLDCMSAPRYFWDHCGLPLWRIYSIFPLL